METEVNKITISLFRYYIYYISTCKSIKERIEENFRSH